MRGRHRGLLAVVGIVSVLASGLLANPAQAKQGVVIVLENTGESSFVHIFFGFDNPPYDPNGEPDFRVGGAGPTNVDFLRFRNHPVSESNPQPPGTISCTRAVRDFQDGTRMTHDAQHGDTGGWSEAISTMQGYQEIVPDVTVLSFDTQGDPQYGTRTAGTFRFLSADTFKKSGIRCR